MKSIKRLLYMVLFVAVAGLPMGSKAQISLDSYYNVDWQFNVPLGNNFSNVASAHGMFNDDKGAGPVFYNSGQKIIQTLLSL